MNDRDMPPLDPSLARLLGAEKARPGPDAAAREAVWSRLAGSLPVGPGPGGAPPGGGPPAGEAPSNAGGAPPGGGPPAGEAPSTAGGALPGGGPPAGEAPSAARSVPAAPAPAVSAARGPFTLVGHRAVAALAAMFVAGGITGGAVVASLRRPPPVTASLGAPVSEATGAPAVSSPLPETTAGAAAPAVTPVESASAAPSSAPGRAASPALSSGATVASGGAPAASSGAPGAPSGAATARRDVDLAAERSLLDEARAALARGEGARCLATLARHQSEFPGGRLSLEREVLTIQALVVSGRRDEAVRRAQAFRAAHPKSLLWPAVEAAVGPIP